MAPAHSQARAVCCSRRVSGLFSSSISGVSVASVCCAGRLGFLKSNRLSLDVWVLCWIRVFTFGWWTGFWWNYGFEVFEIVLLVLFSVLDRVWCRRKYELWKLSNFIVWHQWNPTINLWKFVFLLWFDSFFAGVIWMNRAQWTGNLMDSTFNSYLFWEPSCWILV